MSVAMGLQYENEQLCFLIQQLLTLNGREHVKQEDDDYCIEDVEQDESVNSIEQKKKHNSNNNHDTNSEDAISEEYIRFVEETEKHRRERDRAKNEEFMKSNPTLGEDTVTDEILKKANNIDMDFEKLKEEMTLLYGA